jgi:hypothetical protein
MPQVLVRIDAAGEYPVVVDDGKTLLAKDGTRWRYVCDVGSVAEGQAVCTAWLVRRQTMARNRGEGPGPSTLES